jgi:hypothetical protein
LLLQEVVAARRVYLQAQALHSEQKLFRPLLPQPFSLMVLVQVTQVVTLFLALADKVVTQVLTPAEVVEPQGIQAMGATVITKQRPPLDLVDQAVVGAVAVKHNPTLMH